ncbi:MAG: hypothetical protein J3K34DRAFT_441499 [Monoraphidium minutum]|nr:MAG: hypothetical protein J3K34DRAFT_441499 [Monoraphidium minutum]
MHCVLLVVRFLPCALPAARLGVGRHVPTRPSEFRCWSSGGGAAVWRLLRGAAVQLPSQLGVLPGCWGLWQPRLYADAGSRRHPRV